MKYLTALLLIVSMNIQSQEVLIVCQSSWGHRYTTDYFECAAGYRIVGYING